MKKKMTQNYRVVCLQFNGGINIIYTSIINVSMSRIQVMRLIGRYRKNQWDDMFAYIPIILMKD